MVQWRTCWNIIIVHQVTVSLVKWMITLRLVLVCIIMMMRMTSVYVIGKVVNIFTCWQSVMLYCHLGVLCGQCKHNKGVSVLLNKCKSCGYANMLFLALLCKCHYLFHHLFDQYFTKQFFATCCTEFHQRHNVMFEKTK